MNTPHTSQDVILGLRISSDLLERVRARAEADERSVSSFVRRALARAVQQ
jgi:predicted HicB family RNase H-like nuclease